MFKESTVLIVGAGASFDFGYPLGPSLLTNITNGISDARKLFNKGRNELPSIATDSDFLKYQFAIVYENASQVLNCSSVEIDKFAQIADSQTNKSVDRFLRDHPNLQSMGKYFIAQEIHTKSYWISKDSNGEQVFPKDFRIGTLGWVGDLINEMREGARNFDDLRQNKITIINFNYDLTIELALDAQFSNTDVHRGADWRDCVEIIHVYGQVLPPRQQFNQQGFWNDVKKSSESIRIIGDVALGRSNDSHLENINSKLSKAERVVSLGFSFDQANVDLLRLKENSIGPKMTVLNYDGHYGVRRTLNDLSVNANNVFAPVTVGGKMSITDAIGYGLLSTPPTVPPSIV
jgi:hypothetical protein